MSAALASAVGILAAAAPGAADRSRDFGRGFAYARALLEGAASDEGVSLIAVRVDVAVRRPPTPGNTRPAWYVLALDCAADGSDLSEREREAQATALAWAQTIPGVVMPVGCTVEWVVP